MFNYTTEEQSYFAKFTSNVGLAFSTTEVVTGFQCFLLEKRLKIESRLVEMGLDDSSYWDFVDACLDGIVDSECIWADQFNIAPVVDVSTYKLADWKTFNGRSLRYNYSEYVLAVFDAGF